MVVEIMAVKIIEMQIMAIFFRVVSFELCPDMMYMGPKEIKTTFIHIWTNFENRKRAWPAAPLYDHF